MYAAQFVNIDTNKQDIYAKHYMATAVLLKRGQTNNTSFQALEHHNQFFHALNKAQDTCSLIIRDNKVSRD